MRTAISQRSLCLDARIVSRKAGIATLVPIAMLSHESSRSTVVTVALRRRTNMPLDALGHKVIHIGFLITWKWSMQPSGKLIDRQGGLVDTAMPLSSPIERMTRMPAEFLGFANFASICPICGARIEKSDVILYSPSLKRSRHRHCPKDDGNAEIWNRWNERLKENERKND